MEMFNNINTGKASNPTIMHIKNYKLNIFFLCYNLTAKQSFINH